MLCILIVITIILFIFAIQNQKFINAKWKRITGNISKVTCGEETIQTVCKTHPNDEIVAGKNPWRKFNDQYHNVNTMTVCDEHYHKICSTNIDYTVNKNKYSKNIIKNYERPYPKTDTSYKLFYNVKTPSISINKRPKNFFVNACITSLILLVLSIFIPI